METLIKTPTSFLTMQYSQDLSNLLPQCIEEIQGKLMKCPDIVMYGKVAQQHRNIGFFSDISMGYRYSGQIAPPQPLTPCLKNLIQKVNALYGAEFNGIFLNEYEDGENYIGPHSDDERHLDKIGVVSVSYGAVRTFRIRNKKTKQIVRDIPMLSSRFLHMGGDFQKEFTHEIPPEKRIQGIRYSFTFRHIE